MSSAEHRAWLADIERLFAGQLSAEAGARVYAHVKTCPGCERAYAELAAAESALYAARHDLSPAARDRVRARLFAGGSATAAAPARWVSLLAGAGALSAALAGVLVLRTPTETDRPQPRGGYAEAPTLNPALTLRALAVRERSEGGFDVEDLSGGSALVPGDHLKLLGTSLELTRWITVAVFDARGRELARLEPQTLAGAQDASLGKALAVQESWIGQVRMVAVFTTERPAGMPALSGLDPGDEPGRSVRVLDARVVGKVGPSP